MYSYYQQQEAAPFSVVTPATVSVSTTNSGLTWNGSSWVPASTISTAVSTCQPAVTDWGCNRNPTIPLNPIATFTDYYHKWTEKYQEQERLLNSLAPTSMERPAVQRQLEWYKYYADQSSRAAHYFYSHGESNVATAPFDLPPEPPQVQQQLQQQQQKQQQSTTITPQQPTLLMPSAADSTQSTIEMATFLRKSGEESEAASYSGAMSLGSANSAPPPESLKRYVDRCLSQYESTEDKTEIMKIIQDTMETSLKNGTMHSINWDTVPLIQLKGKPTRQVIKHYHSSVNFMDVDHHEAAAAAARCHTPPQVNAHNRSHCTSVTPSTLSQQHHRQLRSPSYQSQSSSNTPSSNRLYLTKTLRSSEIRYSSDSKLRKESRSRARSDNERSSTSGAQQPQHLSSASTVTSRYQHNKLATSNNDTNIAVDDTKPTLKFTSAASVAISASLNNNNNSSTHNSSHDGNNRKPYNNSSSSNNRNNDKSSTTNHSSSLSEDFIPLNTKRQRKTAGDKGGHNFPGFSQTTQSLSDRAKRFSGRGGIHDAAVSTTNSKQASLGGNKTWDRYMGKATIGGDTLFLGEDEYEDMKVKGTNTTLLKDYLRLTAPPKPELVRPQYILEQHLSNLKSLRRSEDCNRDYLWFCSQLKAIRQDLTVQHLVHKNAFAVDVYETHARIALEEGDMNEFNQCQTQLKELYRSFEDSTDIDRAVITAALKHQGEFVAYRLLYYVIMSGNPKYDGGSSDLFKIMLSLTPQQRTQDKAIQHALAVREAIADVNYHHFFALRRTVTNLGGLLMDQMLTDVRYNALNIICKAYRPVVKVMFVLTELGFQEDCDDKKLMEQYGIQWLISCGCILSEDRTIWKTKDSIITESKLEAKKTLI